jgi:hypothetical protein
VAGESTTRKPRRASKREPPERLPWLRYDRMARAVTERLRVRAMPGQPFWLLSVRNPVHHTRYQVALPEYPGGEAQFCSCVDFARKGIGTCKHIEAARAWLEAQPDVHRLAAPVRGASAIWRAMDAARREGDRVRTPDAVHLREPGRVLFERGVSPPRRDSKKREGRKGSAQPASGSGA